MAVLVIGTPYDVHMGSFIRYLTESAPSIGVDLMSIVEYREGVPTPKGFEKIYFKKRHFPQWVYRLPGMQNILSALDFRRSLKESIKGHYSVVNVRYVSVENAFCYRLYHKLADKILITPYGSDILRAPGYIIRLIRPLMRKADYISGPDTKLGLTVKKTFGIPDDRFVDLYIGSTGIDAVNGTTLTREDAKSRLGLDGRTTITIGYNASVNQNHLSVIDALSKLPKDVKEMLTIMLPFTYPVNVDYVTSVKVKLDEQGLAYKAFEQFMSVDELVVIRMASDIFINAQSTDASSASLKEYLLANNVVLNASWLEYPMMCKYGSPFLVFNSYDELPALVESAMEKKEGYELNSSIRSLIAKEGWKNLIKDWVTFFNNVEAS